MRNEQSGLMASVVWHCWRLLSFRGDWKSMPDSSGFAWIAMSATLVGGLTEQLAHFAERDRWFRGIVTDAVMLHGYGLMLP